MTTRYEEGDNGAQIVLIGEAPSWEELRAERPFCGPSGKLLDLALHSAKISRAECRLLNVFEDQISKKDDDAGKIFSKQGDLLWTPKGFTEAGLAATEGFRRRLAACNANVIVTLGGVALSAVLDNRSVTKHRGSIYVNSNGRKIVPTIHPAFILRGAYENRYLLISDLTKARDEASSPEFIPTPRNLIIDPSHAQCVSFLKQCLDSDMVNTDIEILRGQVDCFSLAVTPSEAISIPLIDAGFEHRWSVAEEAEIWTLYAQLIQSPRITKVNQNITFDLSALLELNGIVPCGPLHDPMVAHSIIYPALRKDLGTLCSIYTRHHFYKDQGDLHDSQTVADFARRWNYSATDSAISLECWQALAPLIESEGYQHTYDMTMNLVSSLLYMMVHGIRISEDELLAAREQARIDLAVIVNKLGTALSRKIITEAPKAAAAKREAVDALNVNSPAQLMKLFYDEMKLRPYTNQIGARSIDDKALARLFRRDGIPAAKLLQEYRSLAKMISSYLEVEYDADLRVRSNFSIRGTWTGRLSSSKTIFGRGLNFQNIAPEFRGFLVADHA